VNPGKVFLLDSSTGTLVKVNSPLLLEAAPRQAEFQEVAKAVGDPKSTGSKRLREKYGTTLDGVLCATRPFDFYLYAYAATLNTYHARAIRAKVKDIVGRRWKIEGEGQQPLRDRIEVFFRNAFGEQTFDEGMGNIWTDYESLGNGYLEVVPTRDRQEYAELAHLPAPEVWVRLDGLGFVQQKNGEYSHFRRWGVPDEEFTGLREKDPLRAEDVTSVIHFSRYFPWSPYYGIPSIMPAWNSVALAVLQSEYNLAFFANNAIPDYAVILEGEWEDDAEKVIQEYFRTHLKGQAHKTMCLRTPNGGKVTFERLTSDNAKEASFRLLRIDCRDEILHAHGVPPQKVGIVETGKLGGNLSSEQIEEYKNSIVLPGRDKVATRLNRLIEQGFGTRDLKFGWEPYDTEDIRANAEVDRIYVGEQVLVPNEVRRMRFPDLQPLAGGDEPKAIPGAAAAEEALGQMQTDIRQALAKLEAR
jgi:PBSX family phage portal protein